MVRHLIPIDKLTLSQMMFNFIQYRELPDNLIQLPVPQTIRIRTKDYLVPQNLDEFTKSICYGQRIFLTTKEDNDFGVIIRLIDGYYFPLVTKKKWDDNLALLFGKIVITCKVVELYPVSMHLTTLISEMTDREQKLLHREPSKMELAAGIERLNNFSELTALLFLRDALKIPVEEVLLTPYRECLVHFMLAKEQADFQEKYQDLQKEEIKPKSKYIK